jgi:hypothetical protein
MIMYQLAQKLGFGKELVKNYKMQKVKGMDEPSPRTSCARSTSASGPSATRARAPSA